MAKLSLFDRRRRRVRTSLRARSAGKPRLSVHRSGRHIYAQVIDDTAGKTIASAYSVRPKPGAPVSTPLRWDEVNESLDPAAFTMDVVKERVAREGDLFEGVLTSKQSLGAALKAVR